MKLATACRNQARRIAGVAIMVTAYWAAAPLPTSRAARDELASHYAFASRPVAAPGADPARTLRHVHPAYRHIDAWISSVGAGVAVGDFDGDGVDNDLCLVDPRSDLPVILPVPGTGARYAPIPLAPPASAERSETIAAMGCLLGDLDEDGATDAVVYYWGRVPVGFVHRGDRVVGFELAPAARWFSNAGAIADLDGDGHLDLAIANYFPDGARVLDPTATEPAVMQDSMSRAYNGGAKHFLLWRGRAGDRVEYREVDAGLPAEVGHGWTLGLGAHDLDGDLRPELYLANDFGPDRLLHNVSVPGALRFELLEGERGLTTPRSKVLGRDSFKGMGVDFGDLDRDGDDDIAVSNIAAPWALLESNFLFVNAGRRPDQPLTGAMFVDRSQPLGVARGGWAWDVRFADFDDDGWLEIVQANGFVKGETNRWSDLQELATSNDVWLQHPSAWPHFTTGDDLSGRQRNRLFARRGDGPFVDLAEPLGLPADVSRGLAVGDVDGDGDLDLVVANQWADSQVLINEAPRRQRALWLRLQLPAQPGALRVVPGSRALGSPAIGATATIALPGGRVLTQEVDGGSGHSGKSAPVLHFGLGTFAREDAVPVKLRYRDRTGAVRTATTSLRPGSWTIVLGDAP